MIDLHIHSTYSDGSLTPAELVQMGETIGLKAMALTDHDTISGNIALLEAARSARLQAIPGVEVSAEFSAGTLHLLGYFIRPDHEPLNEALARIRSGRNDRNDQILGKLQAMGYAISLQDVKEFSGEEVVGRPHFAQALLAKGYVKTSREAFDRFLGKGKPAYCDRFRLSPEESISLIAQAGGVPVLAHPSTLRLNPTELRREVGKLAENGLQGIEVYYSEHSREQEAAYLKLTAEFNLVATGGSDFHGTTNPQVRMGTGFGGLSVPDQTVEQLQERVHA